MCEREDGIATYTAASLQHRVQHYCCVLLDDCLVEAAAAANAVLSRTTVVGGGRGFPFAPKHFSLTGPLLNLRRYRVSFDPLRHSQGNSVQ